MKVAVCENDCTDAENLISMLKRVYKGKTERLSLSCYFDSAALARDAAEGGFHLIFCDAPDDPDEMISLIGAIRAYGFKGKIVLLSSDPRIAYYGYLVDAAGVLSKPLDEKKLELLMTHLERDMCGVMSFYSGGEFVNISHDEITYIESCGSACLVHTFDGCYRVSRALSHIEQRLGAQFLRCHRSYIVNMDHIRRVDDDFYLKTGERVLVRKRSQRQMRDIFIDYSVSRGGLF